MLTAVETGHGGYSGSATTVEVPDDFFYVESADERRLAVRISGDPSGYPVFLLHGTPGSRLQPVPKLRLLYAMGVRLISFDRPGYGRSDRKPGRSVADAAADVEAIANYLEIKKFGVLGRSGGGPHALACAALLPERVTKASAMVSLAPFDAEGLDWFGGMSDSNVREYTAAQREPWELTRRLIEAAEDIKANPDSHVATLGAEMPEADRRVVSDIGIRTMLARNFAEALQGSAAGWVDDALAFCAPWEFKLADISVPVLLWHGEQDVYSPVSHTRWLSEQIPGAITTIWPDLAHFHALLVVPDVLAWLIREED